MDTSESQRTSSTHRTHLLGVRELGHGASHAPATTQVLLWRARGAQAGAVRDQQLLLARQQQQQQQQAENQ